MAKTFLDFINNKNNRQILTEAFREKDVEKSLKLIDSILKKRIPGLIPLVGFVDTTIGDDKCMSKQYIVMDKDKPGNSSLFQLNWLTSEKSTDIYSIDFFKDLDVYWSGNGKSDLSIYTLGTNFVRFIPIICDVVNNKNYNLSQDDAIKTASTIFKNVEESIYNIDNIHYTIFEKLSKDIIRDSFKLSVKSGLISESIDKEYAEIGKALGTDAEIDAEVKMAIEKGKSIKSKLNTDEKELEDTRKDPEQIFKEMSKYITLVIKGLQPSLILCGAPGVGKTFRVKKQLKAADYVEGNNLCTIKGKCTARKLYLALYEYQNKNDIVLIDDADSLVGPNADENCINILKAALDSTTDKEGRLVTYGVAGKILDDDGNEIPKRFYFKAGVIVITNYRAGALDTALRGRSFIQDIDFTNKEVLSIIQKLLPNIEPEILDAKSKIKSYRYLVDLNEQGSKMELSLRTFVLCAKIFKACAEDDDFTDDDAKSMIEEQMRLQYARATKNSKY